MGDRTYTRFSFPRHLLTPNRLRHLSQILDTPIQDLQALLIGPAEEDEAADHGGISLRLVGGCACLVWEHDECNYGGYSMEADLQLAGVPYLQVNAIGGEYDAGSTIFDGHQGWQVRHDIHGAPVVGLVLDGRVQADPEELRQARRFVLVRPLVHAGRRPAPPTPISRKNI